MSETCSVCGQPDNCGDCDHYGTEFYEKKVGFVIAVGNPIDGIKLYGDKHGDSFAEIDDAHAVAEASFKNDEWWTAFVFADPRSVEASASEGKQ